MLRQAKRAQLFQAQGKPETKPEPGAKPRKINNREPRYTADGTMHQQDVALGFIDAGWPEKKQ